MRKLKKKEREELKQKFGGRCAYCGDILENKWHADHLEPVYRRHELYKPEGQPYKSRLVGADKMENHNLENFMPSCPSCNLSKATWSLEEWRKVIANYIKVIDRSTPTYRIAKRYNQVVETDEPVVFYFETI